MEWIKPAVRKARAKLMGAKLTLLSMTALALLIVLGVGRSPASPHPSGPTELAPTMRPATSADRAGHAVADKDAANTAIGESPWSAVGRNATLAAASESLRMEPVTLFVMGSLLSGIATFVRLKIMRRAEAETELRLSRNAHR